MTPTPESLARAVVEKFNDDCYMQPSDRACLETLIAAALREAEVRGLTDYRDRIVNKLGLNHWLFQKFFGKAEIIKALDAVDEEYRAQAKAGPLEPPT